MEKVCERVRSESKFNVEIWIIKFNSIAVHYPIVVIFIDRSWKIIRESKK